MSKCWRDAAGGEFPDSSNFSPIHADTVTWSVPSWPPIWQYEKQSNQRSYAFAFFASLWSRRAQIPVVDRFSAGSAGRRQEPL
jgi:hypothetical protein